MKTDLEIPTELWGIFCTGCGKMIRPPGSPPSIDMPLVTTSLYDAKTVADMLHTEAKEGDQCRNAGLVAVNLLSKDLQNEKAIWLSEKKPPGVEKSSTSEWMPPIQEA